MPEVTTPERSHSKQALLTTGTAVAGLLLAACAPNTGQSEVEPATTTGTLEAGQWEITSEAKADVSLEAAPLPVDTAGFGVKDLDTAEYTVLESEARSYLPIAEIRLQDGKLIIDDVSQDGMSEIVATWFADRFAANAPLVEEALKNKSIDKAVIAFDDPYRGNTYKDTNYILGYFDSQNKQNVFEISPDAHLLDASFFEQYIVHEVGHALFSETAASHWADQELSEETRAQFVAACSNLRTSALESIQHSVVGAQTALNKVAELESEPNLKARYALLAESFSSGEWIKFVPTTDHNPNEDTIPECSIPTIGGMAAIAAELNGVPKPDQIQPVDLEDPIQELRYQAQDDANTALQNALRDMSTYRLLTEGNYDHEGPDMGHPNDNLDELAASTLNLMISYPEDFARRLRAASTDSERQAVLDMLRLVVDHTAEAHPDLRGYLSAQEAEFTEALNR